ncbi:MAG: hypothetical protein PHR30_09865 [Gallionellaceae bacterium]|nr:hypothetical protein [Gallionellaceae bacterium]MDD5365634.1 hypothetical protein [Gallionellaceae bacterium]
MLRFVLVLFLLIGLFGCQSMPAPGWHNPNKALGEFDYDFYNCRMMVLQTTPQPVPAQANPAANAVYTQCAMYGNMQQCWQQEAPIYAGQTPPPAPAPVPDPAWLGKIETLTNECVARQGWTHTEAPVPEASAGQ